MAISYPRLSPRGLRGLSIFNIILWVFSSVLTVIFTFTISLFFYRLSSGKKYFKCINCRCRFTHFFSTDCDSDSILKFRSRARLQQHWWTGLHFCWNLGRLVLWCCWNRRHIRKLRAEASAVSPLSSLAKLRFKLTNKFYYFYKKIADGCDFQRFVFGRSKHLRMHCRNYRILHYS